MSSKSTKKRSKKSAKGRKLWVVDDQPQVAKHVQEIVSELGFEVEAYRSGEEALKELKPASAALPDLVLLDWNLGPKRLNGMEILAQIRPLHPRLPVVMLTGEASYRLAVEAVKAGAQDFVEKNEDMDEELEESLRRLEPVLGLVEENRALKAEVDRLKLAQKYHQAELFKKYKMVGLSPAIQKVVETIEEVAPIPRPVLIRGERGTGKELVAAAIHKASDRNGGPFVTINCAAFAEGLLECEMFGQEEGGFTDAAFRKGRFELAHKGTIFLDEIGNMPLGFQQKMLRVLEYQEFSRVGGSATIQVDVRVVAATNADLETAMRNGEFREDLYDRLAFETISLPPLRERREDLAALTHHFLSILSLEAPGRIPESITPEALEKLEAHDWPGNIRAFKNYIERVAYRSRADVIGVEHLLPLEGSSSSIPGSTSATLQEKLRSLERDLLEQALSRHRGDLAEVADDLGITPEDLYERLKLHDLGRRSP